MRSDDKKNDKPDERKVPSGFEKILKRTKRAIQNQKKDEPSTKQKDEKEEENEEDGQDEVPKKPKKTVDKKSE